MQSPTRVLILAATLLCAAAAPAAEPPLASAQGKRHLVPFAAPAYQPETGPLIGGAGILAYQPPRGAGLKESQVLLAAAASLKGQFSLLLQPDVYLWSDRVNVGATASIARWPDLFFGIGSLARAQDEEPYTPVFTELELSPRYRLAPGLYLGPSVRAHHARMLETNRGGSLERGDVLGARGGTLVQVGLSGFLDTRDSTLYPSRGGLVRLTARRATSALGSRFTYETLEADVRHYVPLPWEGHVLAAQALLEVRTGAPPFYDLGRLGGAELMRGHYEGRFRDRQYAAAQLEYRLPLFWRVGAVLFGAAGEVAHTLDALRLSRLELAGGGGLRLAPLADVPLNIRLDAAYGSELAFYFNVGEAF
jgi:hypothetical protein